tara:strand:- start:3816 stop:4775 length:960 start_codon:yes stop_codon:yes gene_type:complete
MQNLYGYKPNPAGVERWLNDPANKHPVFAVAKGVDKIRDDKRKNTVLYKPLMKLEPDWVRNYQKIGDCVSWGWEIAITMMMARLALERKMSWLGAAATESIYGGSRVEARGRTHGGWSDGSYGGSAAKWVMTTGGVLLRKDYSQETGNPEHDLRKYSKDKAKQWGAYGCGGKSDKGELDIISRSYPVKTASLVTSFDEAATAIAVAKSPVPVCSGQGFSSRRDSDGFAVPRGSWAHCMCFIGARFGKRPGLLLLNSWPAPSWNGPHYPRRIPKAIKEVSCWVDADVCDRMLRGADSYAISPVDGFSRVVDRLNIYDLST